MTFRKLFTTIMCITLIITPNFMVNAAIEGGDGNGATTAVLYAACLATCGTISWFSTDGTASPACLSFCASLIIPNPPLPGPPFPIPPTPIPFPEE